jgi:hypothetical protein
MSASMENCFLSKIDFLDGISLGDKHQIPSTKYQTISNQENSKFQTKRFWSFVHENWNLFVIWDLIIGI